MQTFVCFASSGELQHRDTESEGKGKIKEPQAKQSGVQDANRQIQGGRAAGRQTARSILKAKANCCSHRQRENLEVFSTACALIKQSD